MGFALFESSGTFNPASYGLVVGDTLQVVAVGGGKGGQGVHTSSTEDGANGSASSFGGYVTAAGASAQVDADGMSFKLDPSNYVAIGSDGEHGWGSALWRIPAWIPGIDLDVFNICTNLTADIGVVLRKAGATDKAMNGESMGSGNYRTAGGRGGLGYGAGGGGAAYLRSNDYRAGKGGKAGTVKITAVTLSSLNPIAVTVGTGGAGGNDSAKGGKGANGCVAVFW